MSEPTLVIRLAHTSVSRFATIFFENGHGNIEGCNLRSYLCIIDELEEAKRELKSALVNNEQTFLGVKYGTDRSGSIGKQIELNFGWVIETFGYVWPLDNHDLANGKSPSAVYPTRNTKTIDMIGYINCALKTLSAALVIATTEDDADAKELLKGINAYYNLERRYWNDSKQCFMLDVCVTTSEV